jgi:hypothetical protein
MARAAAKSHRLRGTKLHKQPAYQQRLQRQLRQRLQRAKFSRQQLQRATRTMRSMQRARQRVTGLGQRTATAAMQRAGGMMRTTTARLRTMRARSPLRMPSASRFRSRTMQSLQRRLQNHRRSSGGENRRESDRRRSSMRSRSREERQAAARRPSSGLLSRQVQLGY